VAGFQTARGAKARSVMRRLSTLPVSTAGRLVTMSWTSSSTWRVTQRRRTGWPRTSAGSVPISLISGRLSRPRSRREPHAPLGGKKAREATLNTAVPRPRAWQRWSRRLWPLPRNAPKPFMPDGSAVRPRWAAGNPWGRDATAGVGARRGGGLGARERGAAQQQLTPSNST
jgi:hypothetical protein